jgi:F-type H+-transporting ATPase subunit delta
MSTGNIAVRYARALFLSAREKKLLDPVRADMELLLETSRNPELLSVIESPVISSGKKAGALTELFRSRMHALSVDFLQLVVGNNREEYLPGMARHYIRLYKEEKGIQVAVVSSARKLGPESTALIEELVRKAFHTEIELQHEVREDLIGGFVLRIENRQLDASVKGKLASIKKELQE